MKYVEAGFAYVGDTTDTTNQAAKVGDGTRPHKKTNEEIVLVDDSR